MRLLLCVLLCIPIMGHVGSEDIKGHTAHVTVLSASSFLALGDETLPLWKDVPLDVFEDDYYAWGDDVEDTLLEDVAGWGCGDVPKFWKKLGFNKKIVVRYKYKKHGTEEANLMPIERKLWIECD